MADIDEKVDQADGEKGVKISPEIEKYAALMAKDPNSRAFAPLAEAYRKSGMLDEAILVARGGLEKHPNYLSGRVALGRAYFEKGMKEDAARELEAVAKGTPDNIIAQRILGDIAFEQGDHDTAQKYYKTVLILSPSDKEVEEKLNSISPPPEEKSEPLPEPERKPEPEPAGPAETLLDQSEPVSELAPVETDREAGGGDDIASAEGTPVEVPRIAAQPDDESDTLEVSSDEPPAGEEAFPETPVMEDGAEEASPGEESAEFEGDEWIELDSLDTSEFEASVSEEIAARSDEGEESEVEEVGAPPEMEEPPREVEELLREEPADAPFPDVQPPSVEGSDTLDVPSEDEAFAELEPDLPEAENIALIEPGAGQQFEGVAAGTETGEQEVMEAEEKVVEEEEPSDIETPGEESPGMEAETEIPETGVPGEEILEVSGEESMEMEALAAGSMEVESPVEEATGETQAEPDNLVADEIGELSELALEGEDIESTMVISPGKEKIATATMAEIYVQQGHLEKAIEVYRRVLDSGQQNEEAARRLAELERLAGGDEEAAAASDVDEETPGEEDLTRRKIRALELWLERIRRLRDNV